MAGPELSVPPAEENCLGHPAGPYPKHVAAVHVPLAAPQPPCLPKSPTPDIDSGERRNFRSDGDGWMGE